MGFVVGGLPPCACNISSSDFSSIRSLILHQMFIKFLTSLVVLFFPIWNSVIFMPYFCPYRSAAAWVEKRANLC